MRTKPGEISPKMRLVFMAICAYKVDHDGQAPSRRELLQMIGLRSISTVSWYLHRLEKAGLIKVDESDARAIRVIGGSWEPPQAYEVIGKQHAEELTEKAKAKLSERAYKIASISLRSLVAPSPRYPQIAAIGKLARDDGQR